MAVTFKKIYAGCSRMHKVMGYVIFLQIHWREKGRDREEDPETDTQCEMKERVFEKWEGGAQATFSLCLY